MITASGLSQESTPSYEINNDTLVLKMSKYEAETFRLYILKLEHTFYIHNLIEAEKESLKAQLDNYKRQTENYDHRLELSDGVINNYELITESLKEQNKKDRKKFYRRGFVRGGILGTIVTLMVCLLIT